MKIPIPNKRTKFNKKRMLSIKGAHANNLKNILDNQTKEIVLSFTMLISFFSLFLSYNLFVIRNKNLNFFHEDFYILIYLMSIIHI